MRKKKLITAAFISALLFSAMAGAQLANLGRANPLPKSYIRMRIENPKNTTYNTDTIVLNFSVESLTFVSSLNFSYSLDGQEMKPIESMTVIGHEFIPINPGIYRQWLEGSCVFSNLSEGWHNVTVYVIYPFSAEDPARVLQLANTTFMVAPPQLRETERCPITIVIAPIASVAFVCAGLIIYFKKRKH